MKSHYITISAEDCVRVGDRLFFVLRDYNVILSLKINSGEVSIVGSMPEEPTMGIRLGAKIVYNDKNLYFAPMTAKKIWKYNLETEIWEGYDREAIVDWNGTEEMFQAVLYKENIFFIGSCYPAIIVMNTGTQEMEYLQEPYREYKSLAVEMQDCFFRTDTVQQENFIYISSCLCNKILKMNLDTYEYEYIDVGPTNCRYSGIDFDGKFFYLSPRKGNVAICWDGKDKWTELKLPMEEKLSMSFTIGNVLCKEGKIYFASSFIDESYVLENRDRYGCIKSFMGRYWFYKKIDEDTFVSLSHNGKLVIDYKGDEYRYDFQISRDILVKYLADRMMTNKEDYKKMHSENCIINEDSDIDLSLYLKLL